MSEDTSILRTLTGDLGGLEQVWSVLPSIRSNLNNCTLELSVGNKIVAKVHLQ